MAGGYLAALEKTKTVHLPLTRQGHTAPGSSVCLYSRSTCEHACRASNVHTHRPSLECICKDWISRVIGSRWTLRRAGCTQEVGRERVGYYCRENWSTLLCDGTATLMLMPMLNASRHRNRQSSSSHIAPPYLHTLTILHRLDTT